MNAERIPVRLSQVSGKKYKLVHEPAARQLLATAAKLESGPADIPAMDQANKIIAQAVGIFDAHSVLLRGYHAADDVDRLERARAACMAEDVPLFWDLPDDGVLEWKVAANQPFLRCLLQGAMIAAARGHLKSAARDLRRIVTLNPTDEQGSATLLLACLFGLEDWRGAEELCRACPKAPEMQWGLALALLAQEKHDEADPVLRKACKTYSGYARIIVEDAEEKDDPSLKRFAMVFRGYWLEQKQAYKTVETLYR